ncbi:MAG: PilZ domain-containing protein [Acidobacteria bacterium]|nr:PilZ domain-containing protein [Acidobacteriota bacterium]
MDKGRKASRFRASFPVETDSSGGVLVDMSSSGVAFETDTDYSVGDEVDLRVRVGRQAGETMELNCTGTVVRVERREGSNLVAATIEWKDDETSTGTSS